MGDIFEGVSKAFAFIVFLFFLFLAYLFIHNLFMKQIFTQYNNFPCQNKMLYTDEPFHSYYMDDYALESFNTITKAWLLNSNPSTKSITGTYYPKKSEIKIIGLYNARNKGQMFTDQSSSSYLGEMMDTHEKVWLATYKVDTKECKMVRYTRNKSSNNKDYNTTSTIIKTTSAITLLFK